MKKKILAMLLVVTLLGVSVVSGTLAYFTDTAEATNVFTVGDVDITLTEKFDVLDGKGGEPIVGKASYNYDDKGNIIGASYSNIMPGNYMQKDITVTNNEEPAYVRVVILYNNYDKLVEGVDDYFEGKEYYGKSYPKNGEEIEQIYDDIFAGWGVAYQKTDENGNDMRGAIVDKTLVELSSTDTTKAKLIGIDSYRTTCETIRGYELLTSKNNTFGLKGTNNNHPNTDDATGAIMGEWEGMYVYYLYLEGGESAKLIDGLWCPTYFNQDNAVFFEGLQIEVYADAIQAEGFDTTDAAFAALEQAHPMASMRGRSTNDPTDFVSGSVTTVESLEDFAAAIAEGKSIVLATDMTVTETLTVAADKAVIIDLNGNDISYAVANTGASAIINNKGSLTLKGEGTISFVAANPDLGTIPAYATNTITNTGTLVIEDGVVITNGSDGGASYAVDNHGTLIMNGGKLIGDRCALRVAKYNKDNVYFEMNGGSITAKTPAWIQLPGSNANDAPTITVEINDGTLLSTKTPSSADNDVMYTYSFGNSYKNTTVTINGGNFLGGTVGFGAGYKGDVENVAINGGNFEYDVLRWLADGTSSVLYRGTNCTSADTAADLSNALANANKDDTIILTKDVDAGGQVFVTDGCTFDGNGNTIVVDSGSAAYESGLTVAEGTVKNITVTGAYRGLGVGGSGASEMTGDVYYENVTVEGATYGINIGVGNGYKVYMDNCTLCNWNSYSGLSGAEFTNCTFTSQDGTWYASQRISANATFTYTNCEFEQNKYDNANGTENYYLDSYGNGTIVFENCTMDGVAITEENVDELFQIDGVTVIVK